jgi:hypothetical protein
MRLAMLCVPLFLTDAADCTTLIILPLSRLQIVHPTNQKKQPTPQDAKEAHSLQRGWRERTGQPAGPDADQQLAATLAAAERGEGGSGGGAGGDGSLRAAAAARAARQANAANSLPRWGRGLWVERQGVFWGFWGDWTKTHDYDYRFFLVS